MQARQWIAAAVIACSACGGPRRSTKWALGGATMAVTGAGLIASMRHEEEPVPGVIPLGVTLVFVGTIVAIAAGVDAVFGEVRPTSHAPAVDPVIERRRVARERAWQITRASAAAARRDDCAPVVAADAEVRALDPEFHAVVFRRDVAIARCVQSNL